MSYPKIKVKITINGLIRRLRMAIKAYYYIDDSKTFVKLLLVVTNTLSNLTYVLRDTIFVTAE